MVTKKDKQQLHSEFSQRMIDACDHLGWPAAGKGNRTLILIDILPFKISRTAVNKWFSADSVPDATNIGYVANAVEVNLKWLATGEGNKRDVIVNPEENLGQLIKYPPSRQIKENMINEPGGNLNLVDSMLQQVSTRSRDNFKKIQQAIEIGTLSDDDVELLALIANRLENK